MSILKTLLNLNVPPAIAQTLEQHYAQEPDFVNGLEQMARAEAGMGGQLQPIGDPWRTLWIAKQAGLNGLQSYGPDLQIAISTVLNQRVTDLLGINKRQQKATNYLSTLQILGYVARYNLARHEIEVAGEALTEPEEAIIRNRMRDAGCMNEKMIADGLIELAWNNKYHPVREYLACLRWDGQPHIQKLSEYVEDSQGEFGIFVRRWMIGAIAKVFQQAQNRMLVLDGPQNIGKSRFAKWLCQGMGGEYFIEAPINPDDKDCLKRLYQKWIWEVSELGATIRRADVEALKAFVTQEWVTIRTAYARRDTHAPAMASLIGTINNVGGFLNDPTGNRRYMVVKLKSIDWKGYTENLRVDDLWGEAWAAYMSGESWNLQPGEVEIANEIMHNYEIDDPLEGVLLKWFTVAPDDTHIWTATADILGVLEDPYKGAVRGVTTINGRALAGVMTRLGCERAKRKNSNGQYVNGYIGVRLGMSVP